MFLAVKFNKAFNLLYNTKANNIKGLFAWGLTSKILNIFDLVSGGLLCCGEAKICVC